MAEEFDEDDLAPLTREQIVELKRRNDDLENKVRFVVYDELPLLRYRKWRLWHNSSDDIYCNELSGATLYKRYDFARAMRDVIQKRRTARIFVKIAKVTIKNELLKVLKYDV